jgi:adenine phosphoribosyltransferase
VAAHFWATTQGCPYVRILKERTMTIKSKIRTIPDYPKKGIMFRDITTLIKDPVGFRLVIDTLAQRYIHSMYKFDTIVGIESRGFIIGSALSYALGKGFIPIRKKGKLPAEVEFQEYALEYGTDRIEIHKDALIKGERVLLVDDLLATGGTAMAAAALIEKLGGVVIEMAFIVDLPEVGGRKKLETKGYKLFCLTEFEGE